MTDLEALVRRAKQTQHGFTALRTEAGVIIAGASKPDALWIARQLLQSEAHQARMIATFIFGALAATTPQALRVLRATVSRDPDWRVQEILAQGFEWYCRETGYEQALPVIESWLADPNANVRRAASEGPRIWTGRPYFKQHPDAAIRLLSGLRADPSAYVRKSAGNALRDISRKHRELVTAELGRWDPSHPGTFQTYRLAGVFTLADCVLT
jgi:HEAT repeat protein